MPYPWRGVGRRVSCPHCGVTRTAPRSCKAVQASVTQFSRACSSNISDILVPCDYIEFLISLSSCSQCSCLRLVPSTFHVVFSAPTIRQHVMNGVPNNNVSLFSFSRSILSEIPSVGTIFSHQMREIVEMEPLRSPHTLALSVYVFDISTILVPCSHSFFKLALTEISCRCRDAIVL